MSAPEVWYRYENDGEGNVDCDEYEVLKHTPKGVWIEYECNKDKFILNYARKRFAYPTKELALESFVARKQAQRRIVRNQIDRVERAIIAATAINAGIEPPVYRKKPYHNYNRVMWGEGY